VNYRGKKHWPWRLFFKTTSDIQEPSSNICKQGWSLLGWSIFQDSTLWVGSFPRPKIIDKGGSDFSVITGLAYYGTKIDYGSKKFSKYRNLVTQFSWVIKCVSVIIASAGNRETGNAFIRAKTGQDRTSAACW